MKYSVSQHRKSINWYNRIDRAEKGKLSTDQRHRMNRDAVSELGSDFYNYVLCGKWPEARETLREIDARETELLAAL